MSREPFWPARILKQNEILESCYIYLHQDTILVPHYLNNLDTPKIAEKILTEFQSNTSETSLSRYISDTVKCIMKHEKWKDVKARAVAASFDIVETSNRLYQPEPCSLFKEMQNYLSLTRIFFDRKSEMPDFDDFLTRNEGRFVICDDGLPVETVWRKLGKEFGIGFFPENITDSIEQLEYLEQLLDNFNPPRVSPYSTDLPDHVEMCANIILAEIFYSCIQSAIACSDTHRELIQNKLSEFDFLKYEMWKHEEQCKKIYISSEPLLEKNKAPSPLPQTIRQNSTHSQQIVHKESVASRNDHIYRILKLVILVLTLLIVVCIAKLSADSATSEPNLQEPPFAIESQMQTIPTTPKIELLPQAEPSSGTVLGGSTTDNESEITVTAPYNSSCVVKLKNTQEITKIIFYVRAGETVTVKVPADFLHVYFASGDTWYGPKHLFGENTSYFMDEELIDFSQYSWQYTLQPISSGNFTETPIDASEF